MFDTFEDLELMGFVSDYAMIVDGERRPVVNLDWCLATFSPKGTKMSFTNKGGYDGQRARAAEVIGDTVVTVSTCHIGGTMSYYTFEETGREQFNTVMFEEVS